MKHSIQASRIYQKTRDSKKRIVVNRGGTRSTKTYSILQHLLFDKFLTESNIIINVFRNEQTTIRKSVLLDFESLLTKYDENGQVVYDLFNIISRNKQDLEYRYKSNLIRFIGCDDESKLRGVKGTYSYLNEADSISWDKANQIFWRTEKQIFIDFNPSNEDVWINSELEQKRAIKENDVEVIVSNYTDNPFLSDVQVREIEILRDDPQFWRIYGLGEYGKITGQVFPEFKIVPTFPQNCKWVTYGLDFGYTNDPTAFVKVGLFDNELYIDGLIYERGLKNPEIAQKIKDFNFRITEILADSSEPKSIDEIRDFGLNVQPARKGNDSINHGIQLVKQHKINLVQNDDLIKEFKNYKYKTDKKTGNLINEPFDRFNHYIDAVRYAVSEQLTAGRIYTR